MLINSSCLIFTGLKVILMMMVEVRMNLILDQRAKLRKVHPQYRSPKKKLLRKKKDSPDAQQFIKVKQLLASQDRDLGEHHLFEKSLSTQMKHVHGFAGKRDT